MSQLALYGGQPVVQRPLPPWPQSDSLELTLLQETVAQGQWWGMTGTQVKRFERDFAAYHNALYALAVTNGTHAIELALRSLDIGRGDEVIIPAMTYVATAMAVFNIGAVPVAVDCDPATWCISATAVEAAITLRTKAVMPVHFAGHAADMEVLQQLCLDHRLALIEDAAHAHGARWNEQSIGSFGVMSIFSFQNFKLLTAGEGGLLLVNDQALYEQSLRIANCGRMPGSRGYHHEVLGSTYRMSEFQAAVLNAQLTRLTTLGQRRARNGALLDELMAKVVGIQPQRVDDRVDHHARYMYVFTYNAAEFGGVSRDRFVAALVAEGLPAYAMYPCVHETAFYTPALAKLGASGAYQPACPVSHHIATTGVWIHHRLLLNDIEVAAQLVEAIEKVRANAHELMRDAYARVIY
jgi:3-amino-5-hydroxybenzoate synthase